MIIQIPSFPGAVHFPVETVPTFNWRLETRFSYEESFQTLAQAVTFCLFVIVVGFGGGGVWGFYQKELVDLPGHCRHKTLCHRSHKLQSSMLCHTTVQSS